MEHRINKDKQVAIKVFDQITQELFSIVGDIEDIRELTDRYSDCIDYYDEECLDVLNMYDEDCTLEYKMRELVRLHNEFEKALDAYKNYVEENF